MGVASTSFTRAKPRPYAVPNYKYMFGPHRGWSTSSVKHHSETHINKHTVMKQNKGPNGILKSEHNKTTNWTTMIPITDIDSQAPTI